MTGISCDPDLRLRLGSGGGDGHSTESSFTARYSRVEELFEKTTECQQRQQQQQEQITILYNGRMCTCDVTEIQARAIISMAKREMDDQMRKKQQHQQPKESSSLSHHQQSFPRSLPQLSINTKLSKIRSLQQFLQKRKSRLNALSPYNYRPQPLFSVKS